jgi:hypothetical protein
MGVSSTTRCRLEARFPGGLRGCPLLMRMAESHQGIGRLSGGERTPVGSKWDRRAHDTERLGRRGSRTGSKHAGTWRPDGTAERSAPVAPCRQIFTVSWAPRWDGSPHANRAASRCGSLRISGPFLSMRARGLEPPRAFAHGLLRATPGAQPPQLRAASRS